MAEYHVAAPQTSHGGKFIRSPRLIVVHDVEAPTKLGMAQSLANGHFQNARVSIHAIVDANDTVFMVPPDTVAWHCGNGNSVSLGIEHTGYARFSTAEWLSTPQWLVLRNGAKVVAKWCKQDNIPRRWLTPAEVNAGLSGIATHDTMSKSLGGTNHWDPGPDFPYSTYLDLVQKFYGDTPPKPEEPELITEKREEEMFWMHGKEKPAVLVIPGVGVVDLAGVDYNEALATFRDAKLTELNCGSNPALFDKIYSAASTSGEPAGK